MSTFICFCVTVLFYRYLYFVVNQIKLQSLQSLPEQHPNLSPFIQSSNSCVCYHRRCLFGWIYGFVVSDRSKLLSLFLYWKCFLPPHPARSLSISFLKRENTDDARSRGGFSKELNHVVYYGVVICVTWQAPREISILYERGGVGRTNNWLITPELGLRPWEKTFSYKSDEEARRMIRIFKTSEGNQSGRDQARL